MSDERTEQPTFQRRQEARREGRVARSRDLTVAVSLLAVFLVLEGWGPYLVERVLLFTRDLLGQVSAAPAIFEGSGLAGPGKAAVLLLAYCSLPIALVSGAVVLTTHVGQGAWVFVPRSVAPQIRRLSPVDGARRIASARSGYRGLFAALKLAIVGVLLWQVVSSWLEIDGQVTGLESSWALFWENLAGFGVRVSFYLVLLALLEYAVQRSLYERGLRMTRDEIREEAQRQEGDQGIKDRRRRFYWAARSERRGAARAGSMTDESAGRDHAA